jgi:hypothetical protein
MAHFHRPRAKPRHLDRSIRFAGQTITPAPWTKILGVKLDSTLSFKNHVEAVAEQTAKVVNAIRALGKSTWGAGVEPQRQAYLACVLPKFTAAASVWHKSNRGPNKKDLNKATLKLNAIQRTTANHITGGWKSTPREVAETLAYLLPAK